MPPTTFTLSIQCTITLVLCRAGPSYIVCDDEYSCIPMHNHSSIPFVPPAYSQALALHFPWVFPAPIPIFVPMARPVASASTPPVDFLAPVFLRVSAALRSLSVRGAPPLGTPSPNGDSHGRTCLLHGRTRAQKAFPAIASPWESEYGANTLSLPRHSQRVLRHPMGLFRAMAVPSGSSHRCGRTPRDWRDETHRIGVPCPKPT